MVSYPNTFPKFGQEIGMVRKKQLLPDLTVYQGKGYPLQYSGLENSKDCIVYGVAKSRTLLSDFHFNLLSLSFFLLSLSLLNEPAVRIK